MPTKADILSQYQNELNFLKDRLLIKTTGNYHSDSQILKFLNEKLKEHDEKNQQENDEEKKTLRKQLLIRNFFLDIFLVFGIKIAKTKNEKLKILLAINIFLNQLFEIYSHRILLLVIIFLFVVFALNYLLT